MYSKYQDCMVSPMQGYPVFMPNKYATPSPPLENCLSTTPLKTSSVITSHKNSSSSSRSFHRCGSKCQNSCSASNFAFFTSGLYCDAGRNPGSSSSSLSVGSTLRRSLSTTTPFPVHGQSRRSWVLHGVLWNVNKFRNSSRVKLFPLDPLPSCY
jgi:hypothetical protein